MAFVLTFMLGLVPLLPTSPEPPSDLTYLYKVTLVRATPGHFLDLMALHKEHLATIEASGDTAPFWMRHSQGDQWDLMFVFPMESYAAYYHPDRIAQREAVSSQQAAFEKEWLRLVAWQEDLFVRGPDLDVVQARFEGASFFHVEMFKSLPGKQDELYKQREMENAYLEVLDRPQNLIFVRDQGGAIDNFTLGFYRNIKHFAESADISLEDEERAARAAGFDGVSAISPYLRSLIAWHHDTLAVAIP